MTYTTFQAAESSGKVGLAVISASKRLVGFTLHAGVVYKTNFDHSVIEEVSDSGLSYTEVFEAASLSPGRFFLNRTEKMLYLVSSDSGDPDARFLSVRFKEFFSTEPVHVAHDLASGFDVNWEPLIKETSNFGVEIETQRNQLGISIEGEGFIALHCDKDYFGPRFDGYYWENARVMIYSWGRGLPVTEAKLIYRGWITEKNYTQERVTFRLRDSLGKLKSPLDLDNLSVIPGGKVSGAYSLSLQRQVYGYVYGHRPQGLAEAVDGIWALPGTLTLAIDNKTLQAAGMALKTNLRAGDSILIQGSSTERAIESVIDDSTLTLSDALSDSEMVTIPGKSVWVRPALQKPYINRDWLLAAHSIREPKAEIIGIAAPNLFRVDSIEDFEAGDQVEVNGNLGTVTAIVGTNKLRLDNVGSPEVGDIIRRIAVTNLKINETVLTYLRDYDYDATAGTLTLEETAELNTAPLRTLTGSVQYQAGTAQVLGTGTSFTTELDVNSWIEGPNSTTLVEVLAIVSNTELTLKDNPGLGAPVVKANPTYKKPKIFDYTSDVLTCSLIGATLDGTPDTRLLKTGPDIVRDLLKKAGLTADIDDASFDSAIDLSPYKVAVVFPENHNDRVAQTHRDAINKICRSILGAVTQDADFKLGFHVLRPVRVPSNQRFIEHDILDWDVKSDSSQIVKTAYVTYGTLEYSPDVREKTVQEAVGTSKTSQYILANENSFEVETVLVDQADAETLAHRWALMLSRSKTLLSFETKLQGSRVKIGDTVEFSHAFLYSGSGTDQTVKIGVITSAKKSVFGSRLELDDLSGAFSRCGAICSTGNNFSDATDDERLYSGFITDGNGLIGNQPGTIELNRIW